ncbi:hypothetical protein [uncultured Roseibium sp.]|uniref:hypothetical protein n=1 Tax=uncultured Roseibium sp. TaxID=1936171 RepID=UPI0026016954|nr:hypothetical protein [uncultured Roseibium sp.]
MRHLILIALLATPVHAGERDAFLGTWGTEAQCAGEPLKPGGTVLAAPYEIDRLWLKHGQLWCALRWGPVEATETGNFTVATAQCGEDAVRSYFLGMRRSGEEMTLRWDVFNQVGPLKRCPPS